MQPGSDVRGLPCGYGMRAPAKARWAARDTGDGNYPIYNLRKYDRNPGLPAKSIQLRDGAGYAYDGPCGAAIAARDRSRPGCLGPCSRRSRPIGH
ncbi:hypothetical protein SPHV1_2270009 [Novosphingobium sp. KN65.2]|nr:hypothetical protein SPHV1_2270009 [Novosphingobium sp. KN65.2]